MKLKELTIKLSTYHKIKKLRYMPTFGGLFLKNSKCLSNTSIYSLSKE